jgi:hypothetical protein
LHDELPNPFSHFNIPTDPPYYSSNFVLRKYSILPNMPNPPRTPSPSPSPGFQQILSTKVIDEIGTLLLEPEDSEIERFILAFREQWLKYLRKKERKGRFESILPINRDEYNRKVTEASKVDDREEDNDGNVESMGTGVIYFLYRKGYVA